ncbi:MAG: cytochrome c biogenesis protein [Thermoguttaceae bacterium]
MACSSFASALWAGDDTLDWNKWKSLPVFAGGRLMPLDTFARETVEAICGCVNPTFLPPYADAYTQSTATESAAAKQLFPENEPRKFSCAELLLSWLVEPEKWETVPILAAEHKQLRLEVLKLPLFDAQGQRLRYVSVRDVENCAELGRRWAELQVRAQLRSDKYKPLGVDKSVQKLIAAYQRFRALTYSPLDARTAPLRFIARLGKSAKAWKRLLGHWQRANKRVSTEKDEQNIQQITESLRQLIVAVHEEPFSLEKADQASAVLQKTVWKATSQLLKQDDRVVASLAMALRHQAYETHLALYENADQLRLLPALDAGALEAKRTAEDDSQPWLSWQTLRYGSSSLMAPYPQGALESVRRTCSALSKAYLDRENPRRPAEFNAATEEFAQALREFAAEIEPLREKLPILNRDANLLSATAYPPKGFFRCELFYNAFSPFFWSWLLSLLAFCFLFLAVGIFRKPLFWLGIVVLAVGQIVTVCGFALRGYISGPVPLTGMFETTVFVALCVAIFGLWFTLLPITWPSMRIAWEATSLPKMKQPFEQEPIWLQVFRWPNLFVRAALTYWLFITLVIFPGRAGSGYFNLLPKTPLGKSLPGVDNLVVWALGWCVLLIALYCLPRLITAAALSLFTISSVFFRKDRRERFDQVLDRKAFALVGAGVCFLTALIAYFAPAEIMDKAIGSPRPILRDNFWLFVHVLTIAASYGAGALAWGLGNISLGYYLLGHYRDVIHSAEAAADDYQPADPQAAPQRQLSRQPPEICAKLAGYIYKATQAAVLLLAAGTILGALWADVAWGRFWGWDAKEVWALITLLVYMAILHGRYAGWSGNFGLSVGAVLGATAILMAWYGVNFFLGSGLHSYASGTGGQVEVGVAVLVNWLFVVGAALRYNLEIHLHNRHIPEVEDII